MALRERRGVDYMAEPAEVGCEAEFASSEVETVRRAVLRLPEPYREAVVLCELQELSYEEAARAMDCPVGTVRSRLSRARQMLAERLMPRAVRCAK